MNANISEYYDYYIRKPLFEYFYRDNTLENLMIDIIKLIPKNSKNILDVGCKIGWLAWEIKRHKKDSYILGIDISPKRIDIARKLFRMSRLEFLVADIVDFTCNIKFDCIIMMSVYENIPKILREKLHNNLGRLLSKNGYVIIASPTINFERYFVCEYLKQFMNTKEDITKPDIQKLAMTLGGNWFILNI